MARQPQVTRTIITTKVNALCVNTETQTTEVCEFILPRTYKDDTALLKALKKRVDFNEDGTPSTKKAVHIISHDEVQTLYGMSEDKFIANAEILPPRSVKTNDENDDEANA